MSKRISSIVAVLITWAALYLAFRKVNFSSILTYVVNGRYIFLVPALFLLLAYYFFRAVRWGFLLDKNISRQNLFSTTMIGAMANSIFPARAGEFLKAYLLGKREKMSKSTCFATVVLERLWDGLALIFLAGAVFAWVGYSQRAVLEKTSAHISLKFISLIFVAFYLAILFFLIVWKLYSKKVVGLLKSLIGCFSTKGAEFVSIRLEKFSEGINIFKRFAQTLAIALYSLLIWTLAALTIYTMLAIFSINSSLSASFFLLIILAFFMMIPSLGNLGTMQMAFIIGLGAYGIGKTEALSFSLVYQFFSTVPVIIIGLFYFWKDGLSFRKMKEIKKG